MALEGIPLYYMELCIGQKMRKGSVGVWNEISPYLGGVGIASVVVCFLVSLYYNVIIAWCVFYFFKSFQNPLPWSECPLEPVPLGNVTTMKPVLECAQTSPTKYFWYRTTLQISTGIEDSGGINWKLCACLVGTWILIWLCMMKGRRITGKVRRGFNRIETHRQWAWESVPLGLFGSLSKFRPSREIFMATPSAGTTALQQATDLHQSTHWKIPSIQTVPSISPNLAIKATRASNNPLRSPCISRKLKDKAAGRT